MTSAPVAVLHTHSAAKIPEAPRLESIYGGYANARGDISLFGDETSFRVNFKNRTVQHWVPLNEGAQQRYDDALPGEMFEYGRKEFRRLGHAEIEEICSSGPFRARARFA